ncbi:MAG: hypothetical protein CSA45_02390 [Gammaproteobacteria bacterium]|nr:MAG: hypothetical protein CSA45_02390 [Gammaproteobacteria bacterium]
MINKHSRIFLIFSGLLGTVSVAMGAAGAHALHQTLLERHVVETYAKAVDYAMYAALSLLAIAVLQQLLPKARLFFSGYFMLSGALLFSGSLFVYIFSGVKALTMLTPVGGMLLIISWFLLVLLAIFDKNLRL